MVLSDIAKGKILAMSDAGQSQRTIAKEVGCAQASVGAFLKKYDETGLTDRKPGSGRKRITSERDDRRIVQAALKNRRISTDEIKLETGLESISGKTIVRRLRECKQLNSHWAVKKPLLTKKQSKK